MGMSESDRRKQFEARCDRLNKMLDMRMPPALISLFTFTLMENIHGGTWGFLWWHVKHVFSERAYWYRFELWLSWHRYVLRKSEDEISVLIDRRHGLEPEESM